MIRDGLVQRRDAENFMRNRRNYLPPVYNIRRVHEGPLPNLQINENLEMDAEIENAIQIAMENDNVNDDANAIPANLEVGAPAENAADIPNENVVVAMENAEVGAVDIVEVLNNNNQVNAVQEFAIEFIKVEPQVHVLDDVGHRALDVMLYDEVDPLGSISTAHSVETASDEVLQASNDPNKPGCSGLHLRTNPNPMNSYAPGSHNSSDDEDSDVEIIGDAIPVPIAEPNFGLIKRQNDTLSGNIAYRDGVIFYNHSSKFDHRINSLICLSI